MSIARHHAEWLSLLEISGPFLSMPVLMDAFPQGLPADDPAVAQELRAAYEEWLDNQGGLQPDPAIHHAWIRYVLGATLGLPDEVLAEGQAIPAGLKASVPEHHETLRPDLVVHEPGGGKARMLIQVYPAAQGMEEAVPGREWKAGPATRMMELLHATEVRLGLVTNGEQWLLVQAKPGESTGYAGWYANLWTEERLTLRAFQTLLGVQRFFGVPDEETLEGLLERSAKDQHEVTDQLGSQVRQAVEILIQAIDRADQDRGRKLLADTDEERLYEAALTVMMRLVFLLAAEERGLLLLGDPTYDQNYAISTLRGQLREMADRQGEEVLERRYDAWCRLLATFRAVYGGVQHENLRLPAYGGSLFDPDRFPFLEGRQDGTDWRTDPADPLPIDNRVVLHLLEALQVLQVIAPGGLKAARTLSFRALDIEQIGHVYEGLLDHQAARATEPVLGLQGTRYREPEIPLAELESRLGKGEKSFVAYLKEQTGRSPGALRKALENGPDALDVFRAQRLRAACGNDEALYRRVLPFAALIRDDDYSFPVVIPAGSVYVTEGATRRQTGTHYTPRSLTEPIVQHTLEPLVYIGPAEGLPPEEWQLRSPKELLELKVCDMAMGSGAFLVQACRYLSERLVEAWAEVSGKLAMTPDPRITPEGRPATGDPAETIIPKSDEERLTLARRLVVDRCLYGVDKNHLAVEMAKLSLWLITLDKNRPFTFLDHALRHGDSLVGADEEMFLRWSESLKGTIGPLYYEENEKALALARQKRQALQAFTVQDVRDAEEKARLLAEAEVALGRIKQGCDLIVGVRLLDDLNQSEKETWLAQLLIEHTANAELISEKAERALQATHQLHAFHWSFEFPEVFARGGFDAFIGNPPFLGNRLWGLHIGAWLQNYAELILGRNTGKSDLCVLFLRRAFDHLRRRGTLGMIATDSIRKGDSHAVGLDVMTTTGTIFRAVSSMDWPGSAMVKISVIWLAKNLPTIPRCYLNGAEVMGISSYLTANMAASPKSLYSAPQAFEGSHNGRGESLVLSEGDEWLKVLKDEPSPFCRRYVTAEDLNSHSFLRCNRWIVDCEDLTLEEVKQQSPLTYRFLVEAVQPIRTAGYLKSYPKLAERWWQLWRHKADLYRELRKVETCLVMPVVSKYVVATRAPTEWVFTNKFFLLPETRPDLHLLLLSSFSDAWMRTYSGPFGSTVSLSITKALNTFPTPRRTVPRCKEVSNEIEDTTYSISRRESVGFTTVYNWLHDQAIRLDDIARLRELVIDMDKLVSSAYGWDDLDLSHGFHESAQGIRFTISERARRQVLTRLLKLNHERYAEEVRLGLHEKGGKGKKRAKGKKGEGQMSLL